MALQVGDKIETWFSGQEDKHSTVISIRRYDGLYPEYFSHFITVTAPRTCAGSLEMSYHDTTA